jgi:hypothetical protein
MDYPSSKLPASSACGNPLGKDADPTHPGAPEFSRSAKEGGKPRRRWWRRGLLLALVLGASLYWFRVPLLRRVATYLVVDEPAAATDYLLILPGVDGRYDYAARQYHAGSVFHILLLQRRPGRLEKMGLQPSFEALSQRELAARGVPQDTITLIPVGVRNDWDRGRFLHDWLQHQPGVRVALLCDRFGGRRMRQIFDETLGPKCAAQLRVISLPDRLYDESNWWQHRVATVDLFASYIRFAYARFCGEPAEEGNEWDPKAYLRSLR